MKVQYTIKTNDGTRYELQPGETITRQRAYGMDCISFKISDKDSDGIKFVNLNNVVAITEKWGE